MAYYVPELTIPQFISEEEASERPRVVKRRAKLDWADSPDVAARREKAAEILDVVLPSLAVQQRDNPVAERKQLDNPLDLVRLDLSSAVAKPIPLLPPLVPVNVIDEGALLAEVLGAAPTHAGPLVSGARADYFSATRPHDSVALATPVTQQRVAKTNVTNVTEAATNKLPKWRPCKVSTQDECFMQSEVDAEDGDTDRTWTSYIWGDAPKAKDNPYRALDPSDPARNRYRAIIDARRTLKGDPVQSTGSAHDGLCKWSYADGCRPADSSVTDTAGDIMTFQAKWYLAELSLDINGVHEALLIRSMKDCRGTATYVEAIKQTPAFRARMARVCFDRGTENGNCKTPCAIANYSTYGYNIRNSIRASLGNFGGVMDTRYCGYEGVVAKPSMCDHLKGVLGQNSPIVSACKLAESILAQPWIKALIGVFVPALLSGVITGVSGGWLPTLLIPHFSKLGLSWALGDEATSNLNLDGFWPSFDSFRAALNAEYEVWRATPDINASVRYYAAIMFYVGTVIYKGIRVYSVAMLTQSILSPIMGFGLSTGTALFTGIAGYVTSPVVLLVVSLCIVFAVSKVLPLIPQVSDISSLSVAIYNMFDINNALGSAWGYGEASTDSLGGLAAHILKDIALHVWTSEGATQTLVHHAAAKLLHSNATQVVRSEEENQQHYARRLRGYLRVVAGDNHESLEKEISKSVVAALGTDAKVYMDMLCENNDNDVGGGGADGVM